MSDKHIILTDACFSGNPIRGLVVVFNEGKKSPAQKSSGRYKAKTYGFVEHLCSVRFRTEMAGFHDD
jgi:hypothetical protein